HLRRDELPVLRLRSGRRNDQVVLGVQRVLHPAWWRFPTAVRREGARPAAPLSRHRPRTLLPRPYGGGGPGLPARDPVPRHERASRAEGRTASARVKAPHGEVAGASSYLG